MGANGENEWAYMTDIKRVRYIHAQFLENNSRKSFEFKRECTMQLRMKGFGRRDDRAVITAYDNYFQLAYRTGQVWEYMERIFDMWENCEVKDQKAHADMHVQGVWKYMQGLYDDEVVVPVLRRVVLRELSLQAMAEEFVRYRLQHVVQQVLLRALYEQTWSECMAKYKEHASDKIVEDFIPVFKGWNASSRKRRPCNAELTAFPDKFNAHIEQAKKWFQVQQRTSEAPVEARGKRGCAK